MDRTALRQPSLIAVIGQIQARSGLECPPPTGVTGLLEILPKFDSNPWPFAPVILATRKAKSPAPRPARPARAAGNAWALKTRHTAGPVRHPAWRRYDEARIVGDQMQAPELSIGQPVHSAVARGQLERNRLPADQRNLNSCGTCAPFAVSSVAVLQFERAPFPL